MKTITPEELLDKIERLPLYGAHGENPQDVWQRIRKAKLLFIEEAKVGWENEAIIRSMDEHIEDIL